MPPTGGDRCAVLVNAPPAQGERTVTDCAKACPVPHHNPSAWLASHPRSSNWWAALNHTLVLVLFVSFTVNEPAPDRALVRGESAHDNRSIR